MFNAKIAFDQPWWLLLLVLIPVLWIFSFRSLSGLGPYRRIFALLFRTLATLRLDAPVFNAVEELRWNGPQAGFEDRCRRMNVPDLLRRAAAAAGASAAGG